MSVEYSGRLDRPLFIYAGLIIISLFFYHATVSRFIGLWQEDGYSHGFLLLAICIYIFFQQWKPRQSQVHIKPSVSGLVLLSLLSIIWAFASITLIEKIELISFLLIWPAILLAVFGWKTTKPLLFPFFLLLFAAPTIELFNNFLRKATAVLSGMALDASGLTIFVDGFILQIPEGSFEVDTGCSGLRVITIGVVLALLYVYMNRMTIKQAGYVVLLAVFFSFLSNIIRVYIIVLAGHFTHMQHRLVRDHADLGWFLFVIMMALFYFFVHRYLSKTASGHPAVKEMQDIDKPPPGSGTKTITSAGVLLCLLAMGIGPAAAYYLAGAGTPASGQQANLPLRIANMQMTAYPAGGWAPEYKAGKGQHYDKAVYIQDGLKIYLHVRYFFHQSRNNEAINVNNRVYQRSIWSEVSSRLLNKTRGHLLPFPVEETIISKGDSTRMLVWRWYESAQKQTGDPRIAKLNNLSGTMRGDPSIIVYICAIKQDRELALLRDKLRAFVKDLDRKYN